LNEDNLNPDLLELKLFLRKRGEEKMAVEA
jgi:hypothetical protein